MALHGTERQAERDRDYAREEVARLQARCSELEQHLRETERRVKALEVFASRFAPAR